MSNQAQTPFGNPEDEDLFDFPVSPAYENAGRPESGDAGQEVGTPAQAPESFTEPNAESNAQPDAEPDVAPTEAVASAAPAAKAETKPTAVPVEAVSAAFSDEELDEDLFAFDSTFEDTQPLATDEDLANLEQELNDYQASAENLNEEVAQESTQVQETATETSAVPAPGNIKRKRDRQEQPTSKGGRRAQKDIPESMWVPPAAIAVEPKRGPLLEILAVSFLALNTALILLAWRAGNQFSETLASVTHTVTDSVAEGHAQGQLRGPINTGPLVIGSAPVVPTGVTSEVKETPETTEGQTQEPSELLDMPRASLELAEQRIRKGRYSEARKGLFRLLANRDRTALSESMVIEAETLIAESYAVQSKETK